jgi:hypothetical protein
MHQHRPGSVSLLSHTPKGRIISLRGRSNFPDIPPLRNVRPSELREAREAREVREAREALEVRDKPPTTRFPDTAPPTRYAGVFFALETYHYALRAPTGLITVILVLPRRGLCTFTAVVVSR